MIIIITTNLIIYHLLYSSSILWKGRNFTRRKHTRILIDCDVIITIRPCPTRLIVFNYVQNTKKTKTLIGLAIDGADFTTHASSRNFWICWCRSGIFFVGFPWQNVVSSWFSIPSFCFSPLSWTFSFLTFLEAGFVSGYRPAARPRCAEYRSRFR